MATPRKRPLKDSEQFYAYIWKLGEEVIWVGYGHDNRGRPSKCNTSGRPKALVSLLKTKWNKIQYEVFPCKSRQEARELEVKLTLDLNPKYNIAVGFAGFAGKQHKEESKRKISAKSLGRPASELCKQKSRERMIERNKKFPPRKGVKCSEEHKKKVSESHKGKKLSVDHKQKLREAIYRRERDSKGRMV